MDGTATLSISSEKVCYIIAKARQFEAKDVVADPDSGSNAADDKMVDVLEDQADDPVYEELTAFIGALDEDERAELVALTWLGRGDAGIEEWSDLRSEAARARTSALPPICSACRCSPSIWRKAFPNSAARVKIKRPPLFLPGLLRRPHW
jgi:Protein of unknown function (DUF3775)